jgi:hypothetical protein
MVETMKPSDEPASVAIERIAKTLCDQMLGPYRFDGALMNEFRWKALMMFVDQRDQEFRELVKQLNKAFKDERKRRRGGTVRRAPQTEQVQRCNCSGCDQPSNPERTSMPRCDWCMVNCPIRTGEHVEEETK